MADKTLLPEQDKVTEFNEELANQLTNELESLEIEDTDKFVMKELLRSKGDDLRFKTELKDHQITAITKLLMADTIIKEYDKFITKKKNREDTQSVIRDMTNLYMQLLVSKERKGRLEFIDAWKGGKLKEKVDGLMARFTGRGQDI